jgi:phage baseplate assembly protein W
MPPTADALRRAYGRTLAAPLTDPGGDHARDLDLAPDPATGRRDLRWVAGAACLAQDLELALTTALGSDLFNAGFGFDGLRAVAEETRPALVRERVRLAVVRTVRADPRIARVLDVVLTDARPAAPAAGRAGLRVRVDCQTAAGETVRIDLAGVPAVRIPA